MALLQVAQQVHDLGLHGTIERRRRFVQNHETRLQHHGAGDGDPLALTARELVRIAVLHVRVEPDLPQRVADDPATLLVGAAEAVRREALPDDLPGGQPRAEAGEGVLEHDLHVLAQRAQLPEPPALDRTAIETDGAVALDQAQQRETQGGLAGARLADDAHRVPLPHGERDAVDRPDVVDRAAAGCRP